MKALTLKSLLKTFLYAFAALFLMACSGNGNQVVAPPSQDEIGSGGGGGAGGTPVGEVSNSGFWIDSNNDEFPTYVNNTSAFGTECIIDSGDPLGSISCFIDVMELDLYNNEVKFQYNVAPDMCQHLAITPAWHWNYSVGQGPDDITIRTRIDAAGTEVFVDCTASLASGGTDSCENHPEILGLDDSNQPICAYNHSLGDLLAPNCCLGSYNLTKRTDADDNGTFEDVTITASEWGGSVESCIGGPVRTGTGNFGSNGYPTTTITQVPADGEEGLNAEVTIQANSTGPMDRFSYPANFYTDDNRHSHDGYVSTRVSTLPYAMDPVDDLDGTEFTNNGSTGLAVGNPAYTFSCLDEAFDLRYRISVYLREWNTVSDFLAYGSSNGVTYNPDVIGGEGTDCVGIGIGGSCNDRDDFDDILNRAGVGGAYNTTTVDPDTRALFFPRVGY